MSAFERYFESITNRFPSEAVRYFAKPLLKEAYQQGYADRKAEGNGKKQPAPSAGSFEVVASGRSGASSANE